MAGIVLNFKAQITNLRDIYQKAQKALESVEIGSKAGKSLQKEVENLKALIDSLNRSSARVTTESGIDKFSDKLSDAANTAGKIGRLMSNIKIDDLNINKLGKEYDELNKKIKEVQNSYSTGFNQAFREALNNAPELKKYFEDIKKDINSLSEAEGLELLTQNLKKITEEAEKAESNLNNLLADKEKQQVQINALQSSKILGIDIEQVKEDYKSLFRTADPDKLKQLRINFINAFKGAEGKTTRTWISKIKEEFEGLFNFLKGENLDFSKVIEKVNYFYRSILSESGGRTFLKEEAPGVNNSPEAMIHALFGFDPSGNLNQIKEALETQLNSIYSELSSKKDQRAVSRILNALGANNQKDIDKGIQDYIRFLQAKQQDIKEELIRLNLNSQNTESRIIEATATNEIKNAQKTQAEELLKQYQDKLIEIERKVEGYKQEVETLRREVEALKQGRASAIQKAGTEVRQTASKVFYESAEAVKVYKSELEQVHARERLIGKIEGVVQRWFSIYAAIRMVNSAIKSVINTTKELDKTITEIAIVTNMTQDELWNQMSDYVNMARQYASSISGVYQVSQLYYQQGLQTNDVLSLTEETLKMARISSLSYSDATNYMTNAIRSFKMEMSDAQRVVDVYSEIAASSATSTSELAVAMSKTASSAESVGSGFEETTAMMAVMIGNTVPYNWKVILNPEYAGNSLELFLLNQYSDVLAA